MATTVNLDIPTRADDRARRSVILNILEALTEHDMTKIQAVDAIDDLLRAAIAQTTGRTRAGNDVSGI
jgi:20S proteasome alpha/beta subunit